MGLGVGIPGWPQTAGLQWLPEMGLRGPPEKVGRPPAPGDLYKSSQHRHFTGFRTIRGRGAGKTLAPRPGPLGPDNSEKKEEEVTPELAWGLGRASLSPRPRELVHKPGSGPVSCPQAVPLGSEALPSKLPPTG